ncbi:MAG: hypothetical protein K1Y36_10370 [Blastocatellia bacterium]|nr:hypothetical protein [Blastocatellia bacterium]
MAHEDNPQVGKETAQAATSGAGAPAPTQDDQASESELSAEQLRAEVKKTRAEAAENRKKLREAETKLKTLEAEKLSETERKEREIADRIKAAEEREKAAWRREVLAEAKAMGFVDPEDGLNIPNDAEDISSALAELVKRKPHYVKSEEPAKTTTSAMSPAREKKNDKALPAFDPKRPPDLGDTSLWSRK